MRLGLVWLALAGAACARGGELADLAPEGGRVAAETASTLELCYAGRPAGVVATAAGVRLAGAGWSDIVVENVRGRWLLRATRGERGITGALDEDAAGCAGVRLSLALHALPPEPSSRSAGPRHIRVPPSSP